MYVTNIRGMCEYRRKLEQNLVPFCFIKEFNCDPTFNIINTNKN